MGKQLENADIPSPHHADVFERLSTSEALELEQRIRFQTMLAGLSNAIVTGKHAEMDALINDALGSIASAYRIDRASLWSLDKREGLARRSYEWAIAGMNTDRLEVPLAEMPWSSRQVLSGDATPLVLMDDLPAEAAADREYYAARGVKSGIVVPLQVSDEAAGLAAFATLHDEVHWSPREREEINLLGQLIGRAWLRHEDERRIRDNEEELRRRVRFQTTIAELSNQYAAAPYDQLEEVIDRSLPKVAEYYDVDRMSLWWFEEQGQVAKGTLLFGFDVEATAKVVQPFSSLPWVIDYLYSGHREPFLFPNDFPAEAAADKAYYESRGVKSCLIVPLMVGDQVAGVAGMAATRAYRSWSKDEQQELALFGEILGNTWVRYQSELKIRERERDLEQRVAFQTLLASVSSELATSTPDDIHDKVDESFERLAGEYGFERVSMWSFDRQSRNASRILEWASQSEYRSEAGKFRLANAPWITGRILAGERGPFLVPDEVPEDASEDYAYFRERGVKSAIIVPIVMKGELSGVIGFSALSERRDWGGRERTELLVLAHMISAAWLRRENERQLRNRQRDLVRSQRVAKVGSYVVWSEDGSRITWDTARMQQSSQANDIFGIRDGEETQELILSRYHPDDRERVVEIYSNIEPGTDDLVLDYRVLRPDGGVVYVEERAELDYNDAGELVRVFGTVMDVTERVMAANELEKAFAEIQALKDQLQAENILLKEEVRAARGFNTIVGDSEALQNALLAAGKVAPTDVTVLILGETGTGKELIARSIHELSERRDGPLISVNCAALSSELIESELFGHEQGAFTGAQKQRKGRFELADGGTLFLDEIGDLSIEVQAKILRVLQSGEFERLGGQKTLAVDVRIVAATNRDMLSMVENGEFRADLYYRINNFPIDLPPLRERKEDIPALANFFVQKYASEFGKEISSISPRMLNEMCNMPWPGNVRELEGFIQRALIASSGPVLDFREAARATLPESAASPAPAIVADVPPPAAAPPPPQDLESMHRQHIREVLERCNWVIAGERGAAAALGIPPSSLRSRMKRLGIERPH